MWISLIILAPVKRGINWIASEQPVLDVDMLEAEKSEDLSDFDKYDG